MAGTVRAPALRNHVLSISACTARIQTPSRAKKASFSGPRNERRIRALHAVASTDIVPEHARRACFTSGFLSSGTVSSS